MKTVLGTILVAGAIATGLTLAGCKRGSTTPPDSTGNGNGDAGQGNGHEGHDHSEEVSLGTATIGGMDIDCAQGHGKLEAGKEMHLVVKLPYADQGATVVRAWIGTDDRTASMVAKGDYAASHDDYDVHVEAPNPLPDDAMWWIEIEKPDGTKSVGSIAAH